MIRSATLIRAIIQALDCPRGVNWYILGPKSAAFYSAAFACRSDFVNRAFAKFADASARSVRNSRSLGADYRNSITYDQSYCMKAKLPAQAKR